MKDYLLSEIVRGNVDVSKADTKQNYALWEIQRAVRDFDIEPRDMVELPCKQRVIMVGKEWWFVYSRIENGFIANQAFDLEEQADEFLQELKNGKV